MQVKGSAYRCLIKSIIYLLWLYLVPSPTYSAAFLDSCIATCKTAYLCTALVMIPSCLLQHSWDSLDIHPKVSMNNSNFSGLFFCTFPDPDAKTKATRMRGGVIIDCGKACACQDGCEMLLPRQMSSVRLSIVDGTAMALVDTILCRQLWHCLLRESAGRLPRWAV